ncbi:hypothetical protein MP228_007346 [Amoeboaphelidium protococcarum]|nr:hypothetical protein MP228_007346 [Amoeboaphelidium protococcarum]
MSQLFLTKHGRMVYNVYPIKPVNEPRVNKLSTLLFYLTYNPNKIQLVAKHLNFKVEIDVSMKSHQANIVSVKILHAMLDELIRNVNDQDVHRQLIVIALKCCWSLLKEEEKCIVSGAVRVLVKIGSLIKSYYQYDYVISDWFQKCVSSCCNIADKLCAGAATQETVSTPVDKDTYLLVQSLYLLFPIAITYIVDDVVQSSCMMLIQTFCNTPKTIIEAAGSDAKLGRPIKQTRKDGDTVKSIASIGLTYSNSLSADHEPLVDLAKNCFKSVVMNVNSLHSVQISEQILLQVLNSNVSKEEGKLTILDFLIAKDIAHSVNGRLLTIQIVNTALRMVNQNITDKRSTVAKYLRALLDSLAQDLHINIVALVRPIIQSSLVDNATASADWTSEVLEFLKICKTFAVYSQQENEVKYLVEHLKKQNPLKAELINELLSRAL